MDYEKDLPPDTILGLARRTMRHEVEVELCDGRDLRSAMQSALGKDAGTRALYKLLVWCAADDLVGLIDGYDDHARGMKHRAVRDEAMFWSGRRAYLAELRRTPEAQARRAARADARAVLFKSAAGTLEHLGTCNPDGTITPPTPATPATPDNQEPKP